MIGSQRIQRVRFPCSPVRERSVGRRLILDTNVLIAYERGRPTGALDTDELVIL